MRCKSMQRQRDVLRRRKLTLPALAMMLLSGCATVPGNCSAIPTKDYDMAFTMLFADEYEYVPMGSALDTYILDAMALKDAVRACKE